MTAWALCNKLPTDTTPLGAECPRCNAAAMTNTATTQTRFMTVFLSHSILCFKELDSRCLYVGHGWYTAVTYLFVRKFQTPWWLSRFATEVGIVRGRMRILTSS